MTGRLLTWLDIPCADLARAQAFYKALLGPRGRVEARGGVVVIGPAAPHSPLRPARHRPGQRRQSAGPVWPVMHIRVGWSGFHGRS